MNLSEEVDTSSNTRFVVPPFAQRCRQAAIQLWRRSFTHPFVIQLLDGTLSKEKFRFYQMQDARYLEAYADVCSIISTRIIDPVKKLWFVDGARMALVVERNLHENYGLDLAYTPQDIAALSLSPDNRAYQNHLLAAASNRSLLEAMAAITPCPWLYAEIGQRVVSRNDRIDDAHPYANWIQEYSDPIFVTYTNELLAHLEDTAERTIDEAEKDRAVELFVLSTRYEYMFWEQAWRCQQWADEAENGCDGIFSVEP